MATFTLTAVSGQVTIRFREILEAILPWYSGSQLDTTSTFRFHSFVKIRARQGNSTLDTSTMVCFRGGSDELCQAFPHSSHWLSWKPQVTWTWAWAKEFLSFIVPSSSSVTVSAKVHFADHTNTIVALGTYTSQDVVSIGLVNVYVGGFIMAHRFILKPTRLRGREFLFVNSLGVLDTVFSAGDVSRETDMAVSSVSVNGEEMEMDSCAVERFKVKTGCIRERRMMDQWQEFFRSTERFVFLQGDVVRRIVVDSIETQMTEHELSDASVTYHYARAFTGRYYEDTDLPVYDYSEMD